MVRDRRSVLLVEQDADIAPLMTFILESAGCDVHRSNPHTCLADIASYQAGVVLLDQRTSAHHGASLSALLRDIHNAHIPVILTSTATNLQKIAEDCQANDILPKPFDIDDLEQKVLYWLNNNEDPELRH